MYSNCKIGDVNDYRDQADTIAEAVLALLSILMYKILFPFVRQLLGSSIVSGQSVDTRFNQN